MENVALGSLISLTKTDTF